MSTAEEVEQMAKYCRKLIAKSEQCDVNVFCLNSSFEIGALMNVMNDKANTDILVTPVFCFDAIVQHMPNINKHLRYVWFHQIDEMCKISKDLTYKAAGYLSLECFDIQV